MYYHEIMSKYELTLEERRNNGYPVPIDNFQEYDNVSVFYNVEKWPAKSETIPTEKKFNVNAAEFVPGSCTWIEQTCVRCSSGFSPNSNGNITCDYHWGKLSESHVGRKDRRYSCCGAMSWSKGCTTSPFHVWDGKVHGMNLRSDFVRMWPANNQIHSVYAIDCEMGYTVDGLELIKVSVVDLKGDSVYSTLVQPENEIVDFNTRFSGVIEEDMAGPDVKRLRQVHEDLRQFIFQETILVGHGLENDLLALKIYHARCVDTAFVFPHPRGLPYRLPLKYLTEKYLSKKIQSSSAGLDSVEDAAACMELILWKLIH